MTISTPNTTHPPRVSTGRLDSIEAARGLAALSVALMHVAGLMNVPHLAGHVGMGGIFAFGYVGVDFFFVLSGFIITYVHHRELGKPAAVPRYLWRRFSRIFPIYWFLLLLTIVLTTGVHIASGKPVSVDIGWDDIPGTVFLLMPFSGPLVEPKYIGVAWTLQFEVLFYLAFCVVLLHRKLGLSLMVAWACFLLAKVAGLAPVRLPWHLDSAHCFQFLLGVGVALLARKGTLPASRRILWLAALALAAAVAYEYLGPQGLHSAYGRVAVGLGSAAVLASLAGLEQGTARMAASNSRSSSAFLPLRCPSWLVRFGSASYSVYLAHILLAGIAYSLLLRLHVYGLLPEWLAFTFALGVALAGSVIIGLRMELPVVRWLKERTGG